MEVVENSFIHLFINPFVCSFIYTFFAGLGDDQQGDEFLFLHS